MPENGSGGVVCSSSLLLCSHPGRRQAETPLIQPVQKSRASSKPRLASHFRRAPNKAGKHPSRLASNQAILLRPLLWKKSFNASVSAVCIEESLSKAHRLSLLCASGLKYIPTNTFPSRDFGRL